MSLILFERVARKFCVSVTGCWVGTTSCPYYSCIFSFKGLKMF